MASISSQAWPGLAPEQQKLLLAALESNRQRRPDATATPTSTMQANYSINGNKANNAAASDANGVNPAFISSSSADGQSASLKAPPPYEFAADDPTLDLDFSKSVDGFVEAFPSYANGDAEGEQGEKRKMSDDFDEDGDDLELGERDAKEAKKPGRKLLTSEPTTKRKAQNRAAQRAFRERKEKHLKDLETKVSDLEKASESANHENSVLRAQVERLQDEVKDYRRRMSVQNNSPTSARPSLDGNGSFGNTNLNLDFNFDFPKFGNIPGSVMPSTQAIQGASVQHPQQRSTSLNSYENGFTNGLTSQQSSVSSKNQAQPTMSRTNTHNSNSSSMFGSGFFDVMGDKRTQSPQNMPASIHGLVNATQDRASPSNTLSSASRSPASNNDQGRSSSCCTSPDPNDWKSLFNSNKANGFSANGRTDDSSYKSANTPSMTNAKTPNSDSFSLDWLANQNGGQFDPVLFGDYREPQNNIVGDDIFSGGFFEDGMPFSDLNAPFNFNLSANNTKPTPAPASGVFAQMQSQQSAQKKKINLMDQVEQQQEGNYAGAPTDNDLAVPQYEDYSAPNLMTCQKIWNQLQTCPRFQTGDFDVDGLCAELSAKAKCTRTGVAVPKEAVEAALWKLASNPFNEAEKNDVQQQTPMSATSSNGRPDAKAEATRRFEMFMAKSG
ncbi:MAG: hypothetical protein Q9162_006482 [Coniocarpon cinnabarinum]